MRRTLLELAAAAAAAMWLAGGASGVAYDVLADGVPGPQAGQGRVCFYRTAFVMGAAIQPDIQLNGMVVGTARPGGFFCVDRPAGNYVAAVPTETARTLSFTLHPGEIKFVRANVGFGLGAARTILELETPQRALAEIRGPGAPAPQLPPEPLALLR